MARQYSPRKFLRQAPNGPFYEYYFAYGSNMSEREMEDGKGISSRGRCRAFLPGYARVFDKKTSLGVPGEGKGNIVPDPSVTVEGVLYELASAELTSLDWAEGGYECIPVTVRLDTGEKVEAWTYQAEQDRRDPRLKPTREYLSKLMEARDILSDKAIAELEAIETLS